MSSKIIAGTTSSTALNMSADTSGILEIQTGSGPTTAITVDASQNVGVGTTPTVYGATVRNLEASISGASGFTLVSAGTTSVKTEITAGESSLLGQVGTRTNHPLAFKTNDTERARFDTSGNLLVGQTSVSPTANGFNVNQSGGTNIYAVNLAGNSSSSGTIAYSLYSTSLAQYQYYVAYNGSISARVTSINGLSDAREKTNVKELETGLSEVLKLQPRRFDWIDGSKSNVAGFIAQEVQEVLPDLTENYIVPEGQEERLGLKMGDMIPTLVKAIQELNAKVTALEAQLGAK